MLAVVWLPFTLPATEPTTGCTAGGVTAETRLAALEVHGTPQWHGYEAGRRPWPGLVDTLLLRLDVRGRAVGVPDSVGVPVPGMYLLWYVTVDQAGNRSCNTPTWVVNRELERVMPMAWPFRETCPPAGSR
jgi:hypothetical protein